MCCGSGTDAVYLAGQGFDVTGIDVSPTALGQARQKALAAKVSVQWVLADVLAPPDLLPFDFIYDRACYHVVRQQKLEAYIETVKRLSHPGSTFLLLSARKDDPLAEGGWGVTEEELRFDFLNLFDIESLREITLETSKPGFAPPAWSAFLKRKAAK
jgi:SAM-dependent methyltransferase